MVQFMSFVLDDAQQVWEDKFIQAGQRYRDAKLVLYREATQTGCGMGQAGMGPFYCPLDETVYLDLGFFAELSRRFGAPGDFAQAYVLAHEIGHHVQHLLGVAERVQGIQRSNPEMANELSVRMELQADCYAGVWAHSANDRGRLEAGDIQEGLGAASAVGDDRIQQRTTGRVNVDSFTHGSAQQRANWFMRGFESGSPNACPDGIRPAPVMDFGPDGSRRVVGLLLMAFSAGVSAASYLRWERSERAMRLGTGLPPTSMTRLVASGVAVVAVVVVALVVIGA